MVSYPLRVLTPRYPVFIIGSPRSGTSMLVQVLMAAGYHGYKEGRFLPIVRGLWDAVDKHFAAFEEAMNPGKVLISNIDREALKRELAACIYRAAEAKYPEAPWFDKNANEAMILCIPAVREFWPESIFIFAKRRGIENVVSRLKKFPSHTFKRHCEGWANAMAAWRRIRDTLPPDSFVEIDQQDMICNPDGVARSITQLLHIPEHLADRIAAKLRDSRPQQTGDDSASLVTSLDEVAWSEQQKATFLSHCAAEMAAFSYTTDRTYGSLG